MSVFLSPQYRNLSLFEMKGEEDSRERAEIIQQLRAQRAVESFFNDGCLVRAATMGVGGGLVGRLPTYSHYQTVFDPCPACGENPLNSTSLIR